MEPCAPRSIPVFLASAVAAVIVGLLGMHALLPHSTHGDAVAASTQADHAAADHTAADHTAADHRAAGPADDPGRADAGDGQATDAAVLCAALLLSAAGTSLLLRALVGRAPRAWRLRRASEPPRAAVARTARRATGPPPEWAFSVVRC